MWWMENVCFKKDVKYGSSEICKRFHLQAKFDIQIYLKHLMQLYLYFIAYHILVPKGEDGSVEVSVKLKGYNQEVLAKNDVQDPVRML